jgi:Rhodopirellula transposase DDE domain
MGVPFACRLTQRVRRKGGGQKPATEMQPGILQALNDLVEPSIRGDPKAPLRWVSLSQRHLSAALATRGFTAGQKLVGWLIELRGEAGFDAPALDEVVADILKIHAEACPSRPQLKVVPRAVQPSAEESSFLACSAQKSQCVKA